MAYSKFGSLHEVCEKFGLSADYDADLFQGVSPVEPSPWLTETLSEFRPLAVSMNTEKARSEFLIAPLLAEVRRRTDATLFSGVEFNVDPKRGLSGFCDFLLSLSHDPFTLQAPVLTLVEAKREDIPSGLGQCAAEMVAAQVFNLKKNNAIPAIYGAVTTGTNWRFLALRGTTLAIEREERYLNGAAGILGILLHIVESAQPAA